MHGHDVKSFCIKPDYNKQHARGVLLSIFELWQHRLMHVILAALHILIELKHLSSRWTKLTLLIKNWKGTDFYDSQTPGAFHPQPLGGYFLTVTVLLTSTMFTLYIAEKKVEERQGSDRSTPQPALAVTLCHHHCFLPLGFHLQTTLEVLGPLSPLCKKRSISVASPCFLSDLS